MTADRADLWVGLTRLYLHLGKFGEARRYAQWLTNSGRSMTPRASDQQLVRHLQSPPRST